MFRLRIAQTVSASGGGSAVMLSWQGLSSRTYLVQSSEDLINWRVVSLIPGTNGTTTYEDNVNFPPAPDAPLLYYRVVISGS